MDVSEKVYFLDTAAQRTALPTDGKVYVSGEMTSLDLEKYTLDEGSHTAINTQTFDEEQQPGRRPFLTS